MALLPRPWRLPYALIWFAVAASLSVASWQDYHRRGGVHDWEPVLWEFSSVACVALLALGVHAWVGALSWRGAYLFYAALFVCIAAPLHAFGLPRMRMQIHEKHADAKASEAEVTALPSSGLAFMLVACAFATYAFVPSGLSSHLLAIFQRAGIEPATVVTIGALFGPAQVGARLIEFMFGRNVHPLWVARGALTALMIAFAMLALLGFSTPVAAAFAVIFGGANGLITIVRGALPLALFGASGYGRLIGRLAAPFLLMQAAAPLVMAFVVERISDPAALALAAAFAATGLTCFLLIRRP